LSFPGSSPWETRATIFAVITAATPELRTWLAAHANDEGTFAAPTTLRRRVSPPM